MPSERMQRQIDQFLDEADQAMAEDNWTVVQVRAEAVLRLDPENPDAQAYLTAAGRAPVAWPSTLAEASPPPAAAPSPAIPLPSARAEPTSFANGRYVVQRFLGEGGAKQVYLAHDTRLDREVAVALLKAEGLDAAGRARLTREARALARLGSDPHIVAVFDAGEHDGRPFLVTELLTGGDVTSLIDRAEDHRLPLAQTLAIAGDICQALTAAHVAGIIHRDLKPGNVWLTAEGVAKLGDFGLAVARHQSRLTQVGALAGTAAYLAPEQALGGAVTPRADLYALGCLLYELVTGRPPFLADDPTAVITQHLHTAPVAPSWLSDRCPPDLEELILRLLAKRPDDRPASADAVRAALERVDPTGRPVAPGGAGANPLGRLARGTFVGRAAELTRLRSAFDDAFAGRGGLVMVVGEPGIGKSRTVQELETYARLRGATVLWGVCPEGRGAPAYWPWLQIGRGWGALHDPATLVAELDERVLTDLARLFPELARLPGVTAPAPPTDPEAAQFALFDAYTQFVRVAAAGEPLVLVLDDLHWADKPALLLLGHLARELAGMRVLVVGTYRDTELARTHPLAEALATLNRGEGFSRVVLRGLTGAEVGTYIGATAGVAVAAGMVERLAAETEGNPFFLSEVVKLLTEEGTLTAERVSDIRVPEGVKEALGRRLDRISAETTALLQVAAIVGREFAYDTLTLLGDADDDTLLKQVEEALAARVIEELAAAGRYRFTHALMQETLLSELSTTRRVRLHGQVGEALERRWGTRADAYASRLARHFGESATLTPRHEAKAVRYARLAGEQAETSFAWDEAARHYESGLSLTAGSDADLSEDEAALLSAVGRCRRGTADYRPAWRSLMRAITLYRERGDGAGVARATLEALEIPAPPQRYAALVDEALAVLGGADPYLEARLLALRASWWAYRMVDDPGGASALARAAELARAHGYDDVGAEVLVCEALRRMEAMDFEAAIAQFHEAAAALFKIGQPGRAAYSLRVACEVTYYLGLDVGNAAATEALATVRRVHVRHWERDLLHLLAAARLARGDDTGIEAFAAEVEGDYFPLDLRRAARVALAGDPARAQALLPEPARAGGVPFLVAQIHAARAWVRLHAGDKAGAREELRQWVELFLQLPRSPLSNARTTVIAELDECLPALGDDATVQRVYAEVAGWTRVRYHPLHGRGADHMAGALALRLDMVDEAEGHYRTGVEWAERERCPVEAGRCLHGLAEVAERRGDAAEAMRLLDRAAALFEQHGAKLYLDQVRAKHAVLSPAGSGSAELASTPAHELVTSAERLLVTVLFTDIAGSTERAAALGDRDWRRLKARHHEAVRVELARFGGREVDTAGDGFFVTFDAPARAVRCAGAIIAAVRELGLEIRAGLHLGEVEMQAGGVSGITVHTGARVAALAGAGEVLVTRTVVELAAGSGLRFAPRGTHTLKGVPGAWELFSVEGDK